MLIQAPCTDMDTYFFILLCNHTSVNIFCSYFPRNFSVLLIKKLLYGMMLDRMSLSVKNEWYDEDGRIYIYFTVEEISEDMNCGRDKAIKLLGELDTHKGIGLIERVKYFPLTW